MSNQVLIIGGGPVGFSLALGLSCFGVKSVVIERRAQVVPESRAIFMFARSLEIFRLWDETHRPLMEAGLFYDAFSIVDPAKEKRILTFDWAATRDLVSPAGGLLIPQNRTEEVLRRAVAARPECELVAGEAVKVVNGDHDARVELADGRSFDGAVLVGCDGAKSLVRQTLGLELVGKTYANPLVLSDEIIRGADKELHPFRFAISWPGFLAGLRYGPEHWRIIASVPEGMSQEEALSPEQHRARVEALFGKHKTETIWSSFFRIHQRHSSTFRQGRIVLAGDAAHINSPAGGQGMNGGIQDAANLAWKLAEALKGGGDLDRLLASYDAERRGVVSATIEETTDTMSRLEFNAPPIVRRTLIGIVDMLEHVEAFRRRAAYTASMLDTHYMHSPILLGNHPMLGRRLDDIELAPGVRISDRAGLKGGVLIATRQTEREPSGGAIAGVPVIRLDPPSDWRLGERGALVIRPDQHVGAVVKEATPQSLAAAVDAAFGRSAPPAQTRGEARHGFVWEGC